MEKGVGVQVCSKGLTASIADHGQRCDAGRIEDVLEPAQNQSIVRVGQGR